MGYKLGKMLRNRRAKAKQLVNTELGRKEKAECRRCIEVNLKQVTDIWGIILLEMLASAGRGKSGTSLRNWRNGEDVSSTRI